MRTLVSTGLIIVLIISGGLIIQNVLDSQSDKLYADLNNIEKYVYSDKWDMASIQFNRLNSKWENEKKMWSMIVDHLEIDSISLHLSELDAFLRTKNQDEVLSRLSILKKLVKHIPEKESPSIKNIL